MKPYDEIANNSNGMSKNFRHKSFEERLDEHFILNPEEIENRSFEMIGELLKGRSFPEDTVDIVKRVIHTTADFDFADNLVFSENAVKDAVRSLKGGAAIVTDTMMAYSGISKKRAESLGCPLYCFMSEKDVALEAKTREVTRAYVSMERAAETAARQNKEMILAVGNAPTALLSIHKLFDEGKLQPSLVIAVPVGFVNVVEAKEVILKSTLPFIVSKGNKGGSTVAAAIINALLIKASA